MGNDSPRPTPAAALERLRRLAQMPEFWEAFGREMLADLDTLASALPAAPGEPGSALDEAVRERDIAHADLEAITKDRDSWRRVSEKLQGKLNAADVEIESLQSRLTAAEREAETLRAACAPLVTFYDDIAFCAGQRRVDDLTSLDVDASLIRPIATILRGRR